MKPIFIIGYMAGGKTTFGRALARRLGREFIDLDFYIEQRFHTTIKSLFAERGEEGFRTIEAGILREVGEMEDIVVACGGGTPCFLSNMDYMLSHGVTVYLDTCVDRIVERLKRNRRKRPLMADKTDDQLADEVRKGLSARLSDYTRADIAWPGEALENSRQINDTVTAFLDRHPL